MCLGRGDGKMPGGFCLTSGGNCHPVQPDFSCQMNLLRWQCQFWKLCFQTSQYDLGRGQNGCFNVRFHWIELSLGFFVFFECILKSWRCRKGNAKIRPHTCEEHTRKIWESKCITLDKIINGLFIHWLDKHFWNFKHCKKCGGYHHRINSLEINFNNDEYYDWGYEVLWEWISNAFSHELSFL